MFIFVGEPALLTHQKNVKTKYDRPGDRRLRSWRELCQDAIPQAGCEGGDQHRLQTECVALGQDGAGKDQSRPDADQRGDGRLSTGRGTFRFKVASTG